MFFTRSAATLQGTFSNPNAVYLSPSGQGSIPSPLNLGLENSRRFRALPAYAVLRSEGRAGFHQLLSNMARLSRQLAAFLRDSPHYELLPNDDMDEVFMIVLFRAKEERLNDGLVEKINGTRQMYLSGTSWKGAKAVRIAVSNWKVDVERDYKAVTTILTALGEGKEVDTTSW
jgi:glutamate/tyrosine decarboxylase-like PLP-dependent enzyme